MKEPIDYTYRVREFLNNKYYYTSNIVMEVPTIDLSKVDKISYNTYIKVTDCGGKSVLLHFEHRTQEQRENSLYKIKLLKQLITEFSNAFEKEMDKFNV